MFLESLEPRQMLAIAPIAGTPFGTFGGNTYPDTAFLSGNIDYLSGAKQGTPLDVGLDFMRGNAPQFGLSSGDLNHFVVANQYTTQHNGLTHVYLQQTFNGLPVADAHINFSISPHGQVLAASSSFIPGLEQPTTLLPLNPQITATSAVNQIAFDALLTSNTSPQVVSPPVGRNRETIISQPDFSLDPIPAELHYVPKEGGGVQLAWRVIMRTPGLDPHWYDASVGAEGTDAGQVIRVNDWVANASYNVFPLPVQDPLFGNRSIVVDPQDPVASPFGWHDTNGAAGAEFTDTRGNNVFAQEDRDGNDTGGVRPDGGATPKFRFSTRPDASAADL
jgi:hypothetical protein